MARDPILVLGTGELGTAVLQNLLAHPLNSKDRPITVLKRSKTSAEEAAFSAQGVDLVLADVVNDSEDHLAALFRPFHTVISCNGMTLPPATQTKLTRVALQASVARYFPWQFGVDYDIIGHESSQDLFSVQLDVRALLRGQSAMKWVIVSTGMFISFLFEPSFGIVDAQRSRVTAIGSWENSLTVTAPRDIGRIVAELVFACPEVEGVVCTAGDTVSMSGLADVIDATLQKKVTRSLKTVDMLKDELAADPTNGMKKYRVVFGEGVGVSWDKAKTFNVERGIELESVEAWARDNLGS
nr:hypothetical protein CFP56_72807 [Quercus suber]